MRVCRRRALCKTNVIMVSPQEIYFCHTTLGTMNFLQGNAVLLREISKKSGSKWDAYEKYRRFFFCPNCSFPSHFTKLSPPKLCNFTTNLSTGSNPYVLL